MSTTLTLAGLDVALRRAHRSSAASTWCSPTATSPRVVGANGSGKSTPDAHHRRRAARSSPAPSGWLPATPPSAGSPRCCRTRPSRCSTTPGGVPAWRRRPRPRPRLRRRWPRAAPAPTTEYAAALERWLALGAADLEDRLPQVAAQVGLDVDSRPAARQPLRRPGRAGRAGRRAAQQVRRAAARRADQRPRRARARADRRVRRPATRARCWSPATTAPSSTGSPTRVVELDLAQQTGRALHRRLVGATSRPGSSRAGRPARPTRVRRPARRSSSPRRAPARRLGGEGAPQRGARQRARQAPCARSSQGARRPAGREGGPAEEGRRPARRRWTSRARSGSCATRSPPGPSRPPSSRRSTGRGRRRDGFRLGPVDLTWPAATGWRWPATTAAARPRCSAPCSATCRSPPAAVARHPGRVGVVDQRRALLEPTPGRRRGRAEPTRRQAARPRRGPHPAGEVRARGEHVDRPARALSMGERTRALMAIFQAREVNLLVLDEPTNHLDVRRSSSSRRRWPATTGRCSWSATTGRSWTPRTVTPARSPSSTGWWPRSAEHAPHHQPAARPARGPGGWGLSGSAGSGRPKRARSGSRRAPR